MFLSLPIILTFLGFKIEATLKTPATSAAPHLSRDIPAMIPKKYSPKLMIFLKFWQKNDDFFQKSHK